MKKTIIGWVLKAPLLLVFISSLIASIYASYKKISNITYGSTIVFAILLILYIAGEYFLMRNEKTTSIGYH